MSLITDIGEQNDWLDGPKMQFSDQILQFYNMHPSKVALKQGVPKRAELQIESAISIKGSLSRI